MRIGSLMFIFKFHIRHIRYGLNWSSYTIAARTYDIAERRVKKELTKSERIEYGEVLASTGD